jgi:type I restriction enzyme S subunit
MSESTKYPLVPLSEVLVQDKEYITELEPRLYPKLSVKLYGKGVVLDEPTDGATVRMKRHQLAKSGQVILSEIWAKRGAIGIVPDEGKGALVTSHFFLFDIDESRLLQSYMRWLLTANYFEPVLGEKARGTTGYAAVRPKHFLACKIRLPPLGEQRRIVARIEELAALIEEAQGLRVKAREEARALLDSALYEVFATAETEGWDYKLVKELCEKPQYGYTESAQLERVGPKFLRITDIQNGAVNWDSVPYCVCKDVDKYRLQPGDMLFARTGATTGKSFLAKECPEAVFASYLIRLQLKPGLEPEYLYWFFQSPQYWTQVYEEKKGSAQANMNARKLSNIVVPIAPSKEERNRIVAYLDGLQAQMDELTVLQDATQAELDVLLPSVLDQAFRGEL